ncbi:MAG: hypothetical protein ACR2MP_17060 [Streptosporangiaceae bacterium]
MAPAEAPAELVNFGETEHTGTASAGTVTAGSADTGVQAATTGAGGGGHH